MSDTTIRIAKLGANHLRKDDVIRVDGTRYLVTGYLVRGPRVTIEATALAGEIGCEVLELTSGELVDIEIG